MQGRRPGSAGGPGGGGKGSRAAWRARGPGGSGLSPCSPRGRGAALQPGSAQGPLVGARPPLVADVSPECAFIIDEPPSPQEGEAGRKAASERARAAGRGEEAGPGTRYKGGGGGRRRGRKHTPARRPAPRLGARGPAAGHCSCRGPGRVPGPATLTPSGPRTTRGPVKQGPGTCRGDSGRPPQLSMPRWPGDAGEVTRQTAQAPRGPARPRGSPPGGPQSRPAGSGRLPAGGEGRGSRQLRSSAPGPASDGPTPGTGARGGLLQAVVEI